MHLSRLAVTPLKVLLALFFAALVVLQTLSFPGQFAHMAEEEPDLAHLRWPATAIAVVLLLCVQVVIVCTWKLLTMVRDDRIFSDEAFRFVDVIVGAVATAWVVLFGVYLYVGFNADDPGVPVLLTVVLLGGAVLGLLLLVMRTLLVQATTLRADMEAVI